MNLAWRPSKPWKSPFDNPGGLTPEDDPPQPIGDPPGNEDCRLCGHSNPPWSAPSPLWNQVMRGGDAGGDELHGGIVCPNCFIGLAEAAGIAELWLLTAQRVKVPLQTATSDGRVWNEQAFRWVQPGDEPCACPVARMVDEHLMSEHTDCCGHPRCGGCHTCLNMLAIRARRAEIASERQALLAELAGKLDMPPLDQLPHSPNREDIALALAVDPAALDAAAVVVARTITKDLHASGQLPEQYEVVYTTSQAGERGA